MIVITKRLLEWMDMSHDLAKQKVAQKAIERLRDHEVIGIGTGSTVAAMLDLLPGEYKDKTFVSSSIITSSALTGHGFEVTPYNPVSQIDIYVDGADFIDRDFCLIKGGGGALTQEKILAAGADTFIVIASEEKFMPILKDVFCPIEVLDVARSAVSRALYKMGIQVVLRPDFRTDNGHVILDLYGLSFAKALEVEIQLQTIPGVVECGLFAKQKPNEVILSNGQDVRCLGTQN